MRWYQYLHCTILSLVFLERFISLAKFFGNDLGCCRFASNISLYVERCHCYYLTWNWIYRGNLTRENGDTIFLVFHINSPNHISNNIKHCGKTSEFEMWSATYRYRYMYYCVWEENSFASVASIYISVCNRRHVLYPHTHAHFFSSWAANKSTHWITN